MLSWTMTGNQQNQWNQGQLPIPAMSSSYIVSTLLYNYTLSVMLVIFFEILFYFEITDAIGKLGAISYWVFLSNYRS